MRTIENPYISVDLSESELFRLADDIKGLLATFDVEFEKMDNGAHVSIAYLLGDHGSDQLRQVAREIAADDFKVRINGVEILEGQSTPFDYLALVLEPGGELAQTIERVNQDFPTKVFPGGLRGHISVFRFKKGALDGSRAKMISRTLEMALQSRFSVMGALSGAAVCVYNARKEREISVPFMSLRRAA